MVSIEDIDKLATLSRLALSTEEKERMQKEFGSILEYIAAINKISAENEAGGLSAVARINVMREDSNPHESGKYTEALLKAAPQKEGQYVKVKKIL